MVMEVSGPKQMWLDNIINDLSLREQLQSHKKHRPHFQVGKHAEEEGESEINAVTFTIPFF